VAFARWKNGEGARTGAEVACRPSRGKVRAEGNFGEDWLFQANTTYGDMTVNASWCGTETRLPPLSIRR